MATDERHTGTKDEPYDVVSTPYHALQGAETCATYLQDAERAGGPGPSPVLPRGPRHLPAVG
jgi:hypothetical protein